VNADANESARRRDEPALTFQSDSIVWPVAGFAALGVSFQLAGYSGAFEMPIGAVGLHWGRLAFLGSVAAAMILAGVFYVEADRTRNQLHLLLPFLLWVGTGMTAIARHQSFISPPAPLVS